MRLNSKSKIIVVGTSGSGKSTLARELSKKLGVADIELDALFWKPNWQQSELPEFRDKILKATSENQGWVLHGNYGKVRDLTCSMADTMIWLDYSKPVVFWRVFKRSLLRTLTNETLWAGNKESFRKTFFSKDSILLWAYQTYDLRKKQYEEIIQNQQYPNLKVLRFTKPKDLKKFIQKL